MLLPRLLTAVALLGALLPTLIWAPVWLWGLLTLLFFVAAAAEWLRLDGLSAWWSAGLAGFGLLCLASPESLIESVRQPMAIAMCTAAALYWLFLVPIRLAAGVGTPGLQGAAEQTPARRTAFEGLAILSSVWLAALELRLLGVAVILSVASVVWIADVAGYFGGRALGRYKLAPQISPGKTREGVACAVGCVLLVGWVASRFDRFGQTLPFILRERLGLVGLMGMLSALTALSVVGDLYESLLKRWAGVKDSGSTLPGHGGVLDRIDALLPVIPVAYLVIVLLRRVA